MALELDLLNHVWKRTEKEQNFGIYNRAIKAARPFSLDNATVDMIAEMSSGELRHRMIPIYREMARLPFPFMWIEFDYHHLHEWRWERGTNFKPGTDIDHIMSEVDSARSLFGKPQRLGFLMDNHRYNDESFRITTFGLMPSPDGVEGHDPMPKAHIFPLVQNVSTGSKKVRFEPHPSNRSSVNELIDKMNDSIMPAICWGMERDTTMEEWEQSPMLGTNGIEPEPIMVEHVFAKREHHLDDSSATANIGTMMFSAALEQKGDLRFLVAALALLNHVPVKFSHFRPKGQLLTKSQMKPFMASSIVTIDIPNTRRRLKFVDDQIKSARAHSRHRRHEVRGHWRVSDRSHGDRWQLFTDPLTLRPRWRLWIEHHERGDAALGWVNQFYSVEGNRHDQAA